MNIIQVKIDFEQGTCQKQGISVVTGDYNSTKIVFEFNESATGRKVFEMKNPNDELVYVDEIINNEVVLVGYKEEQGETTTYSLFGEEGDYTFEVSLYQDNSKLTSVCDYITANKEQVIVDGEEVQEQITLFDNLMNELDGKIQEVENINIVADKEGKITTITITRKDGTSYDVEVLDGVSLENMEINNRNLLVTYGGETDNLGQVVPNIQVGTTTTGTPDMNASVVNVGTDLNPILNFTIPRGRAGSIKFEIVQVLPTQDIQEDTIYLVPYAIVTVEELPTTGAAHTIYIVSSTNKRYIFESGQWIEIASDNRYIEYIYVNDQWEELGGINVDVDLSDYYTKEETYSRDETNTLLNGKQNTLTPGYYITIDNNNVIDVKDVVRTNGQDYIYGNKYFDNFPTTNSQKTPDSDNQLVPKKYVDTGLNGKQNTIDSSHKLSSDLVDDSSATNKFVTSEDKTNWNGKVGFTDYATNLVAGVIKYGRGFEVYNNGYVFATEYQYENYRDNIGRNNFISKGTLENVITGKALETSNNKVTSISSSSTDTQYPSAKCVYDLVGDVETLLTTLDIGNGVS